jgi:predicted transcriptional regulator
MPTISVKLSDATKARIDKLAASKDTTAHALMVGAIEAALDSQEKHSAFVSQALRSRDNMIESGKAFDGDEVIAWLRARGRGEKPAKPRLKSLKTLTKPTR